MNSTTKSARLNFSGIPAARAAELKKLAAKMRRAGYRPQLNTHCGKFFMEGFKDGVSAWIA